MAVDDIFVYIARNYFDNCKLISIDQKLLYLAI